MPSYNKVILVGRLGRDPELRYTTSGAAVANFSIATEDKWKDASGQQQSRTDWHNIQAWRRTAELVGEYLRKGSLVLIQGSLRTDSWEKDGKKQYKTYVNVDTVQFLDTKGKAGDGAPAPTPHPSQPEPESFDARPPDDLDLPF